MWSEKRKSTLIPDVLSHVLSLALGQSASGYAKTRFSINFILSNSQLTSSEACASSMDIRCERLKIHSYTLL